MQLLPHGTKWSSAKIGTPARHRGGGNVPGSGHGFYRDQQNERCTSVRPLGVSEPYSNRTAMKIYISGKMGRPIDAEIKGKFFKAYFELLENNNYDAGVEIVNPASDVYQASLKNWLDSYAVSSLKVGLPYNLYAETLLWDFDKIRECDAIYMLDGWELSKGAKLELDVASSCGITVLFQNLNNLSQFDHERD